MKVGVVAIQGAVSEHIVMVETALSDMGLKGTAIQVRTLKDIEGVKALVLPGGESTTIGKALVKTGLQDGIRRLAGDGVPIMGTCAGCVLLAKEGGEHVKRTRTELLGLMDYSVARNAFGRQRESFECGLEIEGLGQFPAVFIRAPLITKTWGKCRPLATVKEGIVMARQDNMIALSFHPELTNDNRIHKMLLKMV